MSYSEETTQALSAVIARQPFFASLLYDIMTLKEDPKCPTAATDGRTVTVGDWFRKLPIEERVFVLCHEVGHAVLNHLPRAKGYSERGFGPDLKPWNFGRWNRAGDYVINDMLKESGIGTMPSAGLHDTSIATFDSLVDDVYRNLPDESSDDNFDDHALPGDDAPTDAEIKRAVTGARNTAKAQGNLPGAMERVIGELLEPAQPWKDLLRDYVTSSVGKEDTSWSKPNRRRLALPPHVPFPGTQGFAMGTMVVAVDTSGSISETELSAFLGEIQGIIEQVRPRELWLCAWDTRAVLHEVESAEDLEELACERGLGGGGGTDYRCVEPAVEAELIEPEIVICMTDGFVSWPEEFPWNHVTVSTSDQKCPFGNNVKMDLKQ